MSKIKENENKELTKLAKELKREAKSRVGKARYWCGVCYPENMRTDWQERIGDILQVPYAYCIHDKDKLAPTDVTEEHDERKTHVHIVLAFPNTTTYNHVLNTMMKLSADGKQCLNRVEQVVNIRSKYEYLIHNTEASKKANKHQYGKDERITGNNFDIGSYEQLSVAEKADACNELADVIVEQGFTNFMAFYKFVRNNYEKEYLGIIRANSGFLERLCKGNYQEWMMQEREKEFQRRQGEEI